MIWDYDKECWGAAAQRFLRTSHLHTSYFSSLSRENGKSHPMRHLAKTFLYSCECQPNFTEYNPNNKIHPRKFKSTPPVLHRTLASVSLRPPQYPRQTRRRRRRRRSGSVGSAWMKKLSDRPIFRARGQMASEMRHGGRCLCKCIP